MSDTSSLSQAPHDRHPAHGGEYRHRRAAMARMEWPTVEALPGARLYPRELQNESWHQPLDHPIWTETHGHLRPDDPVLGFHLNRRAWALPWWIVKNHHVANLAFDGLPVLVTLCEMCSGAAAFRAEVDGRRLAFRPRGHYNGTLLLEETTTGSHWSPFTGVALTGSMRGTALERLPLSQCLWGEWVAMYPATLALYGEQSLREGHGSKYSPGSPGIGPSMLASLVRPLDERLPHNTLVLGVDHGGSARAYPLATLAQIGPVVNDSLGGADIVVRSRPGTLHALAFLRRVAGRTLTFRASENADVYDEETKSIWNEMGDAVAGPLAGATLAYVDSGIEEWYAFAAYHPGVAIFGAS